MFLSRALFLAVLGEAQLTLKNDRALDTIDTEDMMDEIMVAEDSQEEIMVAEENMDGEDSHAESTVGDEAAERRQLQSWQAMQRCCEDPIGNGMISKSHLPSGVQNRKLWNKSSFNAKRKWDRILCQQRDRGVFYGGKEPAIGCGPDYENGNTWGCVVLNGKCKAVPGGHTGYKKRQRGPWCGINNPREKSLCR